MKKRNTNNRKSRHMGGGVNGINSVFIAFVCALLITLTIGVAVLAVVKAHRDDSDLANLGESSAFMEKANTRVPYSEKIMSNPEGDDSLNGQITSGDIGDGVDDESESLDENQLGQNDTQEASKDGSEVADGGIISISDDYWDRQLVSSASDCVTLAFAGDILFDPGYAIMNRIRQNGGTIEGVIGQGLLNDMRSADIMVVNNEFPYSTRGVPTEGKTFTFRAEPSSAGLLNSMGVDVATLANNHSFDYGQDALVDSLSALDNVGVIHIGAGNNIEEASHPVYFTSQDGIKIAIIAATQIERLDNPDTKGATDTSPGVFRCLDIARLQNEIRNAKEEGAFVIVCIHWGTENQEEIDWWQEKQGPEIVEAGADLIVGGHPHILQKMGYINNVPVVYSLGNYLFNSKTLDTGLLQVTVHSDHSMDLKFVPAIQSGCTVFEATGGEKSRILQHLRDISPGVNIDDDGNVR